MATLYRQFWRPWFEQDLRRRTSNHLEELVLSPDDPLRKISSVVFDGSRCLADEAPELRIIGAVNELAASHRDAKRR
ncbi:hypothetical protein KV691_10425 [Xanthomonas euvesicatoria pv. alangii]|nr:hypothetical protein [Xanthomonas euvesicatoria pv. alangii]